MDRRWIPVDCVKCQAPLLRVERTSAEWPEVEVRRRSRRPGPDRTSWAPLHPANPPVVVYCDDGHLFADADYDLGVGVAAIEAARAAVMEGTERGFLAPGRRSGPVEARNLAAQAWATDPAGLAERKRVVADAIEGVPDERLLRDVLLELGWPRRAVKEPLPGEVA